MKIYSNSAKEFHDWDCRGNWLDIPLSKVKDIDDRFWQLQLLHVYRRARTGGLPAHIARYVVWHAAWIATSTTTTFWNQDGEWSFRAEPVKEYA